MDVYQPVGIGSDFLGYRIEELIGRGGMGVVYRAYDLRLKRVVALKLVTPVLARDERFRERFARESQLLMSLEHPNVVPIYDSGDADGRVYLAMRLVSGSDLGSLLRIEGALDPARAVAICKQVAAALDAAHARGLVHRDVKPSNILLDASDHVYLADFGLTRSLEEDGDPGDDRTVGTPAYLAPEQLEGRPVSGAADLYALGCVLYECLTGEPVFPRTSRLAVAWAHLEEEPPRPTRHRAELPEGIDTVLARALAKAPEQRYPSCDALVAAANEALGLGTTRTSHRRGAVLVAGAVSLGIAVAAVAITTTMTHGAGRPTTAHLYAPPNTLARIDPATHALSKVFDVGSDPVVTAAGDYSVWVYSRGSGQIWQIDGARNRRVGSTPVSPPAKCCTLFTGPVLVADQSGGAWFVAGAAAGHRGQLVHVPEGELFARRYPLPVIPLGVAAGGGSIWVVGQGRRDDEVLRIEGATGHVIARTRFPSSARIDSIAFGFGRLWVVSSAKSTLYRIDPRRRQRPRSLVLSHSRATRAEILPRGNDLFVRVTGDGGVTYWIDRSLHITNSEIDGPPGHEENMAWQGSLWWYDWTTGLVYRQEFAGGPVQDIHVARLSPRAGGPCLTSITEGSGGVWVAVAPSSNHVCTR